MGHAEPRMHRGNQRVVEYLADLGRSVPNALIGERSGRRVYSAIQSYERKLMERKGLRVLRNSPDSGSTESGDTSRLESRCPTFAVRIDGHTPLELATKLGERASLPGTATITPSELD